MAVLLAAALLLLMTPFWMHFALNVSGGLDAQATPQMSYELSDKTVGELFVGPGTFVAFGADEQGHMRDVRLVLWAFLATAAASLAVLAVAVWRNGRDPATWRAIGRGGILLAGAVVVVGIFAAVAFGVAFELFHRVLFPGGNWAFPADSLLIRLYPYAFWQMSAAALGVVSVVGGAITWRFAIHRARSLQAQQSRQLS